MNQLGSGMSKLRLKQYIFCYSVLIPVLLLFGVLRFHPIISTLLLSVRKWNLLEPAKPFVGLNNYIKLFSDWRFHEALLNTTVFAVVFVPASVLLSLPLAALLDSPRLERFVPFYQFVYYIPVVASMVSCAVIWRWIYNPQYGLLNYFLSWFGIPPRGWLVEERLALFSTIIFTVWKYLGYYMVLFFVGLKAIPLQYYEAARVDGARVTQVFFRISLPLLKPVTLLVVVMATILAFNVFSQVMVLTTTEAEMGKLVRVFVYEIYTNAFAFYKMGYASAQAVVLLAIIGLITFVQFRLAREG